jgi:hypothetical protein
MRQWDELIQIASTLVLTDNKDEIIWQYTSDVVYSSQYLFRIISFQGVTPAYTPAVCKLRSP